MNYTEYYKHLMNEALGDVERIKWKQQVPTLSDNIIDSYIEKFDIVRKTRPSAAQHDIDDFNIPKGNDRYNISKYNNWKDFEIFVDYVNGQIDLEKSKGKKFTDIKIDGKPLVKKNGLEIYYATDKHACIRYKGDLPYSWCVSRSDSSNMYNTYRYKHNEPSFYFVKDVEATQKEFENGFDGTFKNPWHFFVIQKTIDGNYIVTNAYNDGDVSMTWNQILEIQPKLNDMEEYFVNVPLTDIEKRNYERFIDGLTDSEFAKLNYQEKESYIDIAIPNNELTDFQFKSLPDDLKNKYIGFGLPITVGQYEIIKKNKSLLKRLTEISIRRFKLYKTNELLVDNLTMVDFRVIAELPNASEILQFKNDIDFYRFIKISGSGLDTLIKLFGVDKLKTLFSQYPQKSFELYDDLETMKRIAQILGEKMKQVLIQHAQSDTYSSSSYRDIYASDVNILISVIDLLLQYRGTLSMKECVYVLSNDVYSNKDVNIISDKIFELYKQGKIEHATIDPIGLNKNYVTELLAWILITNNNPEKVFDYVDNSIWDHLQPSSLRMLFSSNNKTIHRKFANVFKYSLEITPLMYEFIMNLVRKDRQHIITFIQKMGGVENIRNRIPKYSISTLLYNTKTQNLPIIASLIPKKYIEELNEHSIISILKTVFLDGREKEPDIRLKLLFKIIGPKTITENIKGSTFYFFIQEIYRANNAYYSGKNANTIDNLFELLIKAKGNELQSGKMLNDVETILTFSNNRERLSNLINRKEIDNLSGESIYHLLGTCFVRDINFTKNIKLLELLGTNNVSKILPVLANSSYDFFFKVSNQPIVFEYLITQLVTSGVNMSSDVVGSIISCTLNDDVEKIGNILGPEKISLMHDGAIGYNMARRINKDAIINLFMKSFDRDKLKNLMTSYLGKNWESQVSIQTYQLLNGTVMEHFLYKNYYL